MFNPSLQSLLVQAHVEELHRIAPTQNRNRAFATLTHDVDRPTAKHRSAAVKRAINRILPRGRGATAACAAIHGLELAGERSAAVLTGRRGAQGL
jgi:hypothetical protein